VTTTLLSDNRGSEPLDEFVDRVPISALRLWRAKAIQDRLFAVIQVRKVELCFRSLWLRGFTFGVLAHSSRLHCGWSRACVRTAMRRPIFKHWHGLALRGTMSAAHSGQQIGQTISRYRIVEDLRWRENGALGV
jgi:hypothetical protein